MTDTIRIPIGPSGAVVAWATVDFEDYERLIAHRWYLAGRGYAFRTLEGKSVFMHREVLDFPDSEDIDHVNGDKLDNRRSNLNACTHLHNVQVGAKATIFPLRDRIRELRLDGWQNKAIAAELGISAQGVIKYGRDLPSPHRERGPSKWTRRDLIEFVQVFHEAHGRIPSQSDLDGKDGRPWFSTVYRRFSGVAELRDAAGFGAVDLRKTQKAAA